MTITGILKQFTLTDQVALVTGAGRGLGRAISTGFAEVGADIVAMARSVDQIEETANQVRKHGRRCLSIQGDVTNKTDVKRAVENAVREFGKIDILVNNAGGIESVWPAEEWPEDEWSAIFNLNLKSVFVCSQEVAKIMFKQQKGKILNISSVTGFLPSRGIAPYGAARAALHNLTRALALEWREKGIWVNAIAASAIQTPGAYERRALKRSKGFDAPDPPLATLKHPPLDQREATAEQYVPIALFLVSEAADHLTGEIICPGEVAINRT